MTACYDPNAPIETLFEQITDGVAYAELGEAPFMSKQIVDITLLCLAKMGVFNDNLKESIRLPLLNRNWSMFRLHFAKAQRECKANLRLTAGQHFPRAKSVNTSPSMTTHQANTVEALANLVTSTVSDFSFGYSFISFRLYFCLFKI